MLRVFAVIVSILFFLGCGQIENSNTMDSIYYSESAGSPEFVAASIVLKKYCLQCHEFAGYEESKLESYRGKDGRLLYQFGNLKGSPIYVRIRGNSVNTTGNMPTSGSVPSDDLTYIKNWILGL